MKFVFLKDTTINGLYCVTENGVVFYIKPSKDLEIISNKQIVGKISAELVIKTLLDLVCDISREEFILSIPNTPNGRKFLKIFLDQK